MIAGLLSSGQGTSRTVGSLRLGASRIGNPQSDFTCAIQQVLDVKPCRSLIQATISEYVAIFLPFRMSARSSPLRPAESLPQIVSGEGSTIVAEQPHMARFVSQFAMGIVAAAIAGCKLPP